MKKTKKSKRDIKKNVTEKKFLFPLMSRNKTKATAKGGGGVREGGVLRGNL